MKQEFLRPDEILLCSHNFTMGKRYEASKLNTAFCKPFLYKLISYQASSREQEDVIQTAFPVKSKYRELLKAVPLFSMLLLASNVRD